VLTRALTLRRLRMENIQLREAIGLYELSMAIALAQDSMAILDKVADAAAAQVTLVDCWCCSSRAFDRAIVRQDLVVAASVAQWGGTGLETCPGDDILCLR